MDDPTSNYSPCRLEGCLLPEQNSFITQNTNPRQARNQENFAGLFLLPVMMMQEDRFSNSCPQNQSGANFIIANNEELSTHILHRLPVTSLLRFQCVSKLWHSIISSPTFGRLFQCRASSSSAALASFLYFCRTGNKTRFDSITISEHSDSWCDLDLVLRNFGGLRGEIVGVDSCNGLLATAVLDYYDGHMEFRVYNLIARRLRLIPMFQDTPQAKASEILGLSIVFDPLISGHYKLMCMWWLQEKKKYGFTVYLSETRSWRKIKASQEVHKRKFCFKKGVLWRDRLHWIGAGDGCPKTFVWLDLNKYQFNLKMPALCSKQKLMYFGESRGRLYIVELNTSRESFDVFEFIEVRNRKINEVMEDEEEECTKWDFKYHIDLTAMMLDKKNYDEWSILSLMVGDRENKSRVLLLVAGELILYDTNDMTIKKRSTIGCVLRHGSCCCQWNEVYNSHAMIVASG